MSPLTPHGRRAEEFNALLEGRDSTGGERDVRLLEVVGALRSAPEVSPRPAHVAELRERLMAEADLVLSDVERKLALPTTGRSRRDRRVAIAASAIALVGVSSSVAFASQGALPGDTLYPIKRALEGASNSLTFDEADKADRLLGQAAGRLAEVEELARRSDSTQAQFNDTLTTFTSQAEEAADLILDDHTAGDSQGVEELRVFAGSSIEKLSALRDQLPAGALDSLQTAVSALTSIDDLARELCPGCSGGITELPTNLTFLAAAVTEPTEAPKTKAPKLPEYVYTDEGGQDPESTDDTAPSAPQQPGQQGDKPDTGGDKPTRKNPDQTPLSDTTKELTDLLVGDEGLLGKDGLVDGLLGSLLGEDGLVPGLLGGGKNSSDTGQE